jgi:hypothetical protein
MAEIDADPDYWVRRIHDDLEDIHHDLEGVRHGLRLIAKAIAIAGLGKGEKAGENTRQELLEEVLEET